MNRKSVLYGCILGALVPLGAASGQPPYPMGTAFTYQGFLEDGGGPVTADCNFEFELYDAAAAGTKINGITLSPAVSVEDGLFTVTIDFGIGAFNGDARWLGIKVCCPTTACSLETLDPRQELTPAPHALALPGLRTEQNATSPNVIGGNSANSVAGGVYGATIGGGGDTSTPNLVTANMGTVGGGVNNTASGDYATVGGGASSEASGYRATVGGGSWNTASGQYATIPGGTNNTASGNYSFAAGRKAKAVNDGSFVWSDSGTIDFSSTGTNQFLINAAGGVGIGTTTPEGGLTVVRPAGDSLVARFLDMPSAASGVDIRATANRGEVQGVNNNGPGNLILNPAGGNVGIGTTTPAAMLTVDGAILRDGSTMYGSNADTHINLGKFSTTGTNGQDYFSATVGGGLWNTASGEGATVGGGMWNTASGHATIPGGTSNTASGNYSFAAGRQAKAVHDGSFVWSDSGTIDFSSTGTNQFLINAAGGVGIGTTTPSNALHVAESINSGATPVNHVALIENTSTVSTTSADVLALQIHRTGVNPTSINNFITFFNDTTSLGAIEGNGSGGVTNASAGSDFAEYIPKLILTEELRPGDVVGVFGGLVTKRTEGAERIMAISTAPNIVGNDPMDDKERAKMGRVAFIGQALVRVRGPVSAGDFVLASGREDGTAVAVSPTRISLEQGRLIVGRAWEASDEEGVKLINTVVGLSELPSTGVALAAIQGLHEIVTDQEARITALESALAQTNSSDLVSTFGLATPALAGVCFIGWLVIGRSRKGGVR